VSATGNGTDRAGTATGGRRLIAVVYADMVGYSRLIGLDDAGTLRRLRALRRALIDPAIREHGGRLVQTGGDSLLVAFDSIDGAVRCAIKVQQQMPIYDGDQPPDRRIRFRVGINIGDVIPHGTDLHGDGVNIAARLQAECPPGGICVSRTVCEHVHGRLNLVFDPLGPLDLKNISRPVEAFALRLDSSTPTKSASSQLSPARDATETVPLSDKPSVAVLAFTNMGGDIEQEYFADGVADDIITELARVRSLFVIARNSSFAYKGRAIDVRQIARELGVRYILEGSVRRGADRLRVTAQLVDAETRNHLWADRYDRPLQDLFALQDEIALAVAKAISPAVAEAEQRRALRRPPESLGAWEAYQRGLWRSMKFAMDHIEPARKFFNRALELDPTLASAHVELARLYIIESGAYGLRPFQEAALLGAEQARMAVSIDPDDAEAHGVLAFALFTCQEIDAALGHVELALSNSPSCAIAHQARGLILNFSGRPAEGRESLLLAMQHDPRGIKRQASSLIGMTYYFERDYGKAAESLRRTLADYPTDPQGLRWFASALGQLGRTEEARTALSDALAKAPDAFERYTRQRPPWYRHEDYEHMLDGLRKAGWQG
jgi:adenylate cyclase